MRGLIFILVVLGLLAGAAYATKPTKQDGERALKDQLLLALAKEELKRKTMGQQLALTLCRTSPEECYKLVRGEIDTDFTDQTLYVRYDVEGFDHRATCYGAFTQFFCPGGLVRE
ncbi:hypothetical protein [Pseudaestuariivita sp.]|uniref:hypothetical protein n=1 Tax=Pseudaestuariivita sp. TaxID=2211669 RepID=UPI004058AC67